MIDWSKEKAHENNCGYCIDYTCICNGDCFKEGAPNYKVNRKYHRDAEIAKTRKRLADLTFDEHDWGHLHDVVLDLTEISLNQEGLENIYEQLPDNIKHLALRWGLSDTEVRDKIHVFLKNSDITVK